MLYFQRKFDKTFLCEFADNLKILKSNRIRLHSVVLFTHFSYFIK